MESVNVIHLLIFLGINVIHVINTVKIVMEEDKTNVLLVFQIFIDQSHLINVYVNLVIMMMESIYLVFLYVAII